MKTNYFKVDRDIQNHWLWKEKPFSKGQAWIDLLLLATHTDNKNYYKGEVVERKRGEVHVSISFLANRWGWSRGKVDRFLNVLVKDKMLSKNGHQNGQGNEQVNGQGIDTVITIENYSIYQGAYSTDGQVNEQVNGQQNGQVTDRERTGDGQVTDTNNNYKELIKNNNHYKKNIPSQEIVEARLEAFRKHRDQVNEKWKREHPELWEE